MAKSYDDDTNQRLRVIGRRVMNERFGGKQIRLAEAVGISGSFMSEFFSGSRGAGLETLIGLARFAPLEILDILRIDPTVVGELLAGAQEERGSGIELLPDVVRRAARACIELSGCPPADACASALEVYARYGDLPNTTADWWCSQIREHVVSRLQIHEKPAPKLLSAPKR